MRPLLPLDLLFSSIIPNSLIIPENFPLPPIPELYNNASLFPELIYYYTPQQTISGVDVEYTGLSVTVDAPNGVSMVYDGFWGIQITVPTEGATCGLCGNNNGM